MPLPLHPHDCRVMLYDFTGEHFHFSIHTFVEEVLVSEHVDFYQQLSRFELTDNLPVSLLQHSGMVTLLLGFRYSIVTVRL